MSKDEASGPQQQPLLLKIADSYTLSNFVPGANAGLISLLTGIVERGSCEFVYLFGPHSSGKTHVLCALRDFAQRQGREAVYLNLQLARQLSTRLIPERLPYLYLLDNVQEAAGLPDWEQAVFSLYNRWNDVGRGTLLVSADRSFDRLSFTRHDLSPRLGSGLICALEHLDESGCIQALQLRAAERGFQISTPTAQFMVTHGSRDMTHLMAVLDTLDEAQLKEQREITIPFVKRVLGLS